MDDINKRPPLLFLKKNPNNYGIIMECIKSRNHCMKRAESMSGGERVPEGSDYLSVLIRKHD